jgi:hypothetical protein
MPKSRKSVWVRPARAQLMPQNAGGQCKQKESHISGPHPLQRRLGFGVAGILFLNGLLLIKEELPVETDYGLAAQGSAGFHTTHWTVVLKAAQGQEPRGEVALSNLCRLYWSPLYAFARGRGYSSEDAQDLTQSFFLHLLKHHALTAVNPLKGKFRSFLLASFQNHLSDASDSARRLKRGGDKQFVQLDVEEAEKCANGIPEKLRLVKRALRSRLR